MALEATFISQYDAFVVGMGGAYPMFMNIFTDYFQDPSQWVSNANYAASTWTMTGSTVVGAGSGVTPVVGVPLASNAGGGG